MSVVDVYDLASDIGKECEKIIDLFGADSLLKLMPKVINVLELLETIATRNESENTRLQELNDRIAHLECEKQEKAVFRQRFDKELELIEEQWRAETKDLVTLVNNLQEENRRLQKSLGANTETKAANTNTATVPVKDDAASNANTSDLQTLQRFREQVEKHRKEMKMKDAELAEAEQSIQGLNIQMERLTNSSRESRKRQKLLQVQVRSLVEERADFLAQLQDQHREILLLRRRLGIAEKENEDLSKCQDEENDPHRARYSTAELKEILCERDELKSQINDLATELKIYKPVEELKIEEKTFVGLQKKILQYKGRYHLNRTMHHGKKVPKVESENFFANYFRNRAPRVFRGDHYLHYLKWLSLLALTLTPSESSHECSQQTVNLLSNFIIDSSGNCDIWYIK
ncbi:hypothetical protein HA402_013111 [Bradysia odoriphaga]|nr:hypothetical protein HA402_013111 [Bradysia odoriphaga]